MGFSSADSDEALLAAIVGGDRPAFAVLVERHHHRLYRIAYRHVFEQQSAEDIVQDCFLMLWQKPSSFDPDRGTRFFAWMARVVINRARDYGRRRQDAPLPEDDVSDGSTEDREERLAVSDAVAKALKGLPERQREVINLCFYEEMPRQEAAEVMEISLKALESLLVRAKKTLHNLLEPSLTGEVHD